MTDPMQLHALADGELAPHEANALRDALRANPRAAAEVDAILNLKEALATQSLRHADDEAWKACVRRLNAIDKTRRVENFVGRYAWAMCGALFLFILSGRAAMRNVQGETSRTADIVRFSGAPAASPEEKLRAKAYESILKDVASSLDRDAVDGGTPVVGFLNGVPAVQYPLRDHDGDLSLTRIDGVLNVQDAAPMASNPDLSVGVAGGESCLVWHTPGRTWLLAGPRSVEGLAEVVSRLNGAR